MNGVEFTSPANDLCRNAPLDFAAELHRACAAFLVAHLSSTTVKSSPPTSGTIEYAPTGICATGCV